MATVAVKEKKPVVSAVRSFLLSVAIENGRQPFIANVVIRPAVWRCNKVSNRLTSAKIFVPRVLVIIGGCGVYYSRRKCFAVLAHGGDDYNEFLITILACSLQTRALCFIIVEISLGGL